MLFLLLLHPWGKDFSHSSPAAVWDPSHGRQFFTNCSNVSPSHGLQIFMNCSSMGTFQGVQSLRNRLLQCGCPMGSQALPANLLKCGLLSPQVHRPYQEPVPAWASQRVTSSFRHQPKPVWSLPWAAGGHLLHRGPPWAAEALPASSWSSSWAAGEKSLLRCLEHLLPPLLLH